jgi:hypothetical protein
MNDGYGNADLIKFKLKVVVAVLLISVLLAACYVTFEVI